MIRTEQVTALTKWMTPDIRVSIPSNNQSNMEPPALNLSLPLFRLNQQVRFSGGIGIIKNYQSEAQTWAYVIEMELDPEPEVGRLGAETRILLNEAEIHRAIENS